MSNDVYPTPLHIRKVSDQFKRPWRTLDPHREARQEIARPLTHPAGPQPPEVEELIQKTKLEAD